MKFDLKMSPAAQHAALLGALGGGVKGAAVGLVVGKVALWMTLGALGGACVGWLLVQVAEARDHGGRPA